MKIYHYTSIDSLALILENRTIKFNRLDKVDDLEEGQVESNDIMLGHYVFVSCWTENSEESIPLWKMYTDNGVGVRIGLENNMFKGYNELGQVVEGASISGGNNLAFPTNESITPEYIILCPTSLSDTYFYRKIIYVPDIYKETQSAIQERIEGGFLKTHIEFNKIGNYKNNRWKFQNESRFAIVILPRIKGIRLNDSAFISSIYQPIKNNQQLGFTSFFLKLKDEIFDSLEIVLSPAMMESKKIIINSLVKKYAPKATVRESLLNNSLKLK